MQVKLGMMQSKIIGLIGGSGTGKTTFCNVAKELGYTIIDGDKIGHKVLQNQAYNEILNEIIGTNISSKAKMLAMFQELIEAKREYDQVKVALKMVKKTGYGIAAPTLSDMKLTTPEITKQGTRFGVKLKATAPSIHMICNKPKFLKTA